VDQLNAKDPWAKYEDALRCPYCAAMTAFKDRRCPACGNRLWASKSRREKDSESFAVLFVLQTACTTWSAILVVLLLYWVGQRAGISQLFSLLSFYLTGKGLPVGSAEMVLAVLPRWAFLASCCPFLLSLFVWIGVRLHWPPIFYFLLGLQILGMISSILGMLFVRTPVAMAGGGLGLLFSLGALLAVLEVEDDFLKDTSRILLRVDRGLTSGQAFFKRGQIYAARGMWVLAAIHFRRAAGMLGPHPAGYLKLAEACLNFGECALAARALAQVRRMAPESPRLADLSARLDSLWGHRSS